MIEYSEELRRFAANSKDPIIIRSEDEVIQLMDLVEFFPKRATWYLASPEVFQRQLKDAKGDVESMNRIYWRDVAHTFGPYSVCTLWRASELVKGTIMLFNQELWLPAAMTARAVLELTAIFIRTSQLLFSEAKKLPAEGATDFTMVHGLHEFIDRAFVATRLAEYKQFQFPQPDQLTPIIKEVSEYLKEDCLSAYRSLCDFAHPNLSGTAYYWDEKEFAIRPDGVIRRHVSIDADNKLREQLQLKVLWTVGWASKHTRLSVKRLSDLAQAILKRFPNVGDSGTG